MCVKPSSGSNRGESNLDCQVHHSVNCHQMQVTLRLISPPESDILSTLVHASESELQLCAVLLRSSCHCTTCCLLQQRRVQPCTMTGPPHHSYSISSHQSVGSTCITFELFPPYVSAGPSTSGPAPVSHSATAKLIDSIPMKKAGSAAAAAKGADGALVVYSGVGMWH